MIIYVDGCIYRYGGDRLEVMGVGGKCKLRDEMKGVRVRVRCFFVFVG